MSIKIAASASRLRMGAPLIRSLRKLGSIRAYSGNPVVSESPAEWDEHMREIGNVLYEPDAGESKYKMTYSGYAGDYGDGTTVYVGGAISADGFSWTKTGKLITRALEDPYVVVVDGVYHLFAEDKADVPFRGLRRYHSSDFITWVDDGDVFDPQGGGDPDGWESQDVSSPVVWHDGDIWYMLYEGRGNGYGGMIGLATSDDGLNWRREATNPVQGYGTPGEWDEANNVPDSLLELKGTYYMTYHGYKDTYQSGISWGTTLLNWQRGEYNPIDTVETLMLFADGDDIRGTRLCNGGIGLYFPLPGGRINVT
ncbi:MAG: hypothetical protein SVY53_06000 [Chloroflexota bacterium]|nr:hypothetical protein [Chloroflexota bacterium]